MKWIFYVIVFLYMFYRAVYGKFPAENSLIVEPDNYGENNYLNVGSYINVKCKASNKNQKVEWIDPNGNVVTREKTNRMFVQDHFVPNFRGRSPAQVLTITSAEIDDSGPYVCRSGNQTKMVPICVLDPVAFVEPETNVTVDHGRSVTLTCPAKGDPEPKFEWLRKGESVIDEDSSSKYKMMTKYNMEGYQGLLTVISLQPEDSGVYTCVANQINPKFDDCGHSVELNITLNVKHAPIFDDNDTIVYVQSNRPIELKCSAIAYPEAAYKWFKEGKDMTLIKLSDGRLELADDKNQSVLVVNSGASFGQRYKCEASNEYGTNDKYFTMVKLEKPTKPINVIPSIATDTSFELNVTWDSTTLFPVHGFDVQYMKEQKESSKKHLKEFAWKKSRKTELILEEETVSDPALGGIIVKLNNLEEETEYLIRLRAINSAGESPWSDPISASTVAKPETTTLESVPESEEDKDDNVSDVANMSDSTFYGIFFAGGILVVGVACMFVMRMVK